MSISIFLPTRKGSQRVPHKNTRRFSDFEGGLLELKLQQLQKVKGVEAIVLSTNDEASIKVAEKFTKYIPHLKIIPRPDELAASTTDLSDLIQYAGSIIDSEHILWTHVTSPFCEARHYEVAIRKYLDLKDESFDSLVGVQQFQNFLWNPTKNGIINKKGDKQWPNTQDLKPLYEINNAIFLAPRKLYKKDNNRVGKFPYLFEMDKIPSLDIDVEEDFKIATAIYESFFR